jgi:hypothetical protein
MDPIITLEKKPESSLIFIVTLSFASFVLYTILYYIMGQNPLLPLKFDLATYIMCLIITMLIVSIPSLIINKTKLD